MDRNDRFSNSQGAAYWLLFLIAGVFIGAFLHNYILPDPYPSTTIPREATADFKLLAEAWNAIGQHYVDRSAVQPRKMTYGAISGMVDSLGDTGHSGFLSPEMVEAERIIEAGQFAGIGAEIQMKDDKVVIVAPMDGSPAKKAGVRPGDIIVSAPAKSGMTWTQAILAMLIFGRSDLDVQPARISPWFDSKFEPLGAMLQRLEAQTHRRYLKTHTPLDGLPYYPEVSYLAVFRHPLDVFHSSGSLALKMAGKGIQSRARLPAQGGSARGGPRPRLPVVSRLPPPPPPPPKPEIPHELNTSRPHQTWARRRG